LAERDIRLLFAKPLKLARSELVRSCFEAGSKPNSITLGSLDRTGFEPASNQLRTGSEPDSVMDLAANLPARASSLLAS